MSYTPADVDAAERRIRAACPGVCAIIAELTK